MRRIFMQVKEMKLVCSTCNKRCRSVLNLRCHLETEHVYKCSVCSTWNQGYVASKDHKCEVGGHFDTLCWGGGGGRGRGGFRNSQLQERKSLLLKVIFNSLAFPSRNVNCCKLNCVLRIIFWLTRGHQICVKIDL